MMFLMLAGGNVHGVPIEFSTIVIPAPGPGLPGGGISINAVLPDYFFSEPGRIRVQGPGFDETKCPVVLTNIFGSPSHLFFGLLPGKYTVTVATIGLLIPENCAYTHDSLTKQVIVPPVCNILNHYERNSTGPFCNNGEAVVEEIDLLGNLVNRTLYSGLSPGSHTLTGSYMCHGSVTSFSIPVFIGMDNGQVCGDHSPTITGPFQTLSLTSIGVTVGGEGTVHWTWRGGAPGNEITYFGYGTRAAVIRYQSARNLVADGIVGAMTRASLAQ